MNEYVCVALPNSAWLVRVRPEDPRPLQNLERCLRVMKQVKAPR